MSIPVASLIDGDIEGSILDALQAIFQQYMQTPTPDGLVDPADPLKLKKLIEAPLQDDPTQVAPYLVYAPAYEIGRMPHPDMPWEIGGPQAWITFFKAICGTPRRNTRDLAYKAINELSRRVERVVMQHYDLANILAPGALYSPDKSEWVDAVRPGNNWVRTLRRVYGGDNEFYGTALMIWNYTFYRVKDF